MRLKSKHAIKELKCYIHLFLNEGISYRSLCEKYGLLLAKSTSSHKVLRYLGHGLKAIQSNVKNDHYSRELKLFVVKEYPEDNTTINELARKYNLSSKTTV